MLLRFTFPALALFTSLFFSCKQTAPENAVSVREYFKTAETGIRSGGVQMIPVETPKGTFKVWTKRFGNNPRIKVLLLHGGPACTHEYFECFESFLPQEGIEFIYYDQLGSLYSDQPKDTSLWHTARFVEEVEQVRKALGLDKNNFFLLGHSWGGILAIEYALKYQENLKGLIISNMMASCPKYDQYATEVLSKQMPKGALDTILMLEAKGQYTDPKYMALLYPLHYEKHICRMPSADWPDPVKRGLNHINSDIYVLMQGPSEFGISGRLENWDRSRDLGKITAPTLTIGARHDSMDPEYMEWMAGQMPKGSHLHCPNGSHMAMWDDQQTYMTGLINFLKTVDNGAR